MWCVLPAFITWNLGENIFNPCNIFRIDISALPLSNIGPSAVAHNISNFYIHLSKSCAPKKRFSKAMCLSDTNISAITVISDLKQQVWTWQMTVICNNNENITVSF